LAKNESRPGPLQADANSPSGLDVASVAPWVLFWGWVALDSALAYRKSQAALDEAAAAEPIIPDVEPPIEHGLRRWLPSPTLWPNGLSAVQKGARTALIGAPIVAVLGPMLLGRLLRRNKGSSD